MGGWEIVRGEGGRGGEKRNGERWERGETWLREKTTKEMNE